MSYDILNQLCSLGIGSFYQSCLSFLYLVSTMPGRVCREVKDMGPFSSNEMNERMSFKMGVKFAVPLKIGRTFEIYYIRLETKVVTMNYKRYEDRPN